MGPRSIPRLAFLPLAALALGAALLAPPAARADQRDFTLVNNSGQPIVRFYLSPTSSADWGPDRLGRDVLPVGRSMTFVFEPGAHGGQCRYDPRVVSRDGSSTVQHGVNLCRVATVTFR